MLSYQDSIKVLLGSLGVCKREPEARGPNRFQGDGPLRRKDNSTQGSRHRLRVRLRCREKPAGALWIGYCNQQPQLQAVHCLPLAVWSTMPDRVPRRQRLRYPLKRDARKSVRPCNRDNGPYPRHSTALSIGRRAAFLPWSRVML
jgi:hypothetical protein